MNNTDKSENNKFETIFSGSVIMKKLILITGIVVYSLFAVAMVAESGKPGKPAAQVLAETISFETASETENPYLYEIKSSDGKVAVFDNKSGEIIRKTDTLISILPEGDREMLKKGIKVRSDKELKRLLEDFCS
jgi:hypothetical protein